MPRAALVCLWFGLVGFGVAMMHGWFDARCLRLHDSMQPILLRIRMALLRRCKHVEHWVDEVDVMGLTISSTAQVLVLVPALETRSAL